MIGGELKVKGIKKNEKDSGKSEESKWESDGFRNYKGVNFTEIRVNLKRCLIRIRVPKTHYQRTGKLTETENEIEANRYVEKDGNSGREEDEMWKRRKEEGDRKFSEEKGKEMLKFDR